MRAEQDMMGGGRRAELADFLRRRRAELSTDRVGLPATRRRRTPGLRREEVAELAGISTALYAWLEQARDVPVSRRTLESIAKALALSPSDRDHIYALAAHQTSELHEVVTPALERMIDSLPVHAVFVIDHRWDVVRTNRAARVVFDYAQRDLDGANMLELTFGKGRTQFVDWFDVATSLVELFHFDYALYAAEPRVLALVQRLRSTDADFAAIWDRHHVRRAPSAVRRLNHPVAGVLSVEPSLYAVVESPGLRCMMFTPSDERTARSIAALVEAEPLPA